MLPSPQGVDKPNKVKRYQVLPIDNLEQAKASRQRQVDGYGLEAYLRYEEATRMGKDYDFERDKVVDAHPKK